MESLEVVEPGTPPTVETKPEPVTIMIEDSLPSSAAGAELEAHSSPREL